MERSTVQTLVLVGAILGALGVGVAAIDYDPAPISDGVPVGAPDGLYVTVDGTTHANLESAFPDSQTVVVNTSAGNASFQSSGTADITVHKDELTGPWTNGTDIAAAFNDITIDPGDKSAVTVGGDIDTIAVPADSQVGTNDGAADFAYSAASGTASVTIRTAPASTTLYAINDTGYILDKATSDSTGTVTFSSLDSGDNDVRLQTGVNKAPTLSNASPQGGQSSEPTQFSVDVSDANFDAGDTVTVTIDYEGTQVHTETISSNQTVTASIPSDGQLGGTHNWSASATDDYGGSAAANYQYSVPVTLDFREERRPHDLIQNSTNPITIEAIFYEEGGSNPAIITRTTTDGTIDLDGLPVGSEFSVSISIAGYNNRTIRLDSLYRQDEVFLLKKGVSPTVENRFVVNDLTGEFPAEDTTILIQAPVNESKFDSSNPGINWLTVSGDDLGADEAFVDDLEEEKRYRIIVENEEGDQRNLGAYTPEVAGTIELNIESFNSTVNPVTGVGYNATYRNTTSGKDIRIAYNDTKGATDTLYLNIYERGNQSNVLVDNESFTGPFGTFTHTEPVPQKFNETTWVVEVRGDRSTGPDGEARENVYFKEMVGPSYDVLGLPPWLVTILFVGVMWCVAGLFSQFNGHVGGLVVAGLGAMFFSVGLVPSYLGGGVIALSLLTAGILFVRGSRGGL